jgi:plasmid stabilization system protein ParE
MAKQVVLTPIALANYDKVIEYLIGNWNITVVNDFVDRFIEARNILSKNAEIYPFENKKKGIRRCVLTKHNIVLFRESGTLVEILMIFDTRQDPKKLRDLLKNS